MLTHLTLNKKGVTTFVARRVSSCVRTFTESGSAWGLGRGSFSPATAAPATTLLRADPSTPRSVSTDETVPGGTAPELVRKPRDTSCRHPYCLVLRSRPMQASVPPEQGHPHRCRRPPYGHGHHAACTHVPRSAPVTDVPRPGVQRLIALPAAAGPPLAPRRRAAPRPSSCSETPRPLSPSPSRCCPYFTPGTGSAAPGRVECGVLGGFRVPPPRLFRPWGAPVKRRVFRVVEVQQMAGHRGAAVVTEIFQPGGQKHLALRISVNVMENRLARSEILQNS